MIRRSAIGVALFAGMVIITAGLWRATPGSLVPDEDQGYYIGAVFLPDGASLQRTDKVVGEVVEAILSNPANEFAIAFTGLDFLGGGFRNSAATIFVTQKHWDERSVYTPQLVGEFFMKTAHIKEALVLAFGPPPIFGLGNSGGFEFYVQNRGEGGPQRLAQVMGEFLAAANQEPMLAGAQTLWRANVPQLRVDVDREKAKALGVPINDLFDTLSATLGSYYVNDFNRFGRTWQVLMSAEPSYRSKPDSVGELYVRSEQGGMVPVKALATVSYTAGPETLDRFNNLPAVKILGQAAPGVSSGQAIQTVERVAEKVLPADFSFDWGGARSRKSDRRHLGHRPRPGGGHGVPDSSRTVREMVVADLGAVGAPLRDVRRVGRGVAAGLDQRRVLPDRPGHAAGPGREERDLDRRIRGVEAPRGVVSRGCRAGSLEVAVSADPDDLACLHPGGCAARIFHRRGSGRAHLGRDRRDGRDVGRDVPGHLLRADVLQAHRRPALGGHALDAGRRYRRRIP
jgi:uncharacterized membrane protein YiaA